MHTNHRRHKIKDKNLSNEKLGAGKYQRGRNTKTVFRGGRWFVNRDEFCDEVIAAGVSYNFSNGHRGEAKAIRGAKKFVRSRTRFHEKAETRRLAKLEID